MAEITDEPSRIFLRNLPPTITQPDFEAHLRKHFSTGHITDIKLIPQRRIGYVGYKTPDEAKQAVKKFHRSFIRMSKVSVELAKPVSHVALEKLASPIRLLTMLSQIADPSLTKRVYVNNNWPSSAASASSVHVVNSAADLAVDLAADPNQKKRKRDDLDPSDPKLQEYLEVMQSGKNTAKRPREVEDSVPDQPHVVGKAESDDEYDDVPKRKTKSDPHEPTRPTGITQSSNPEQRIEQDIAAADRVGSDSTRLDPSSAEEKLQAVPAAAADDDDWLRQRTNRLLDLVGADELPLGDSMSTPAPNKDAHAVPIPRKVHDGVQNADVSMEDAANVQLPEQDVAEVKESAIDTVHRTSRIFVRNLPYSANEEELHQYFGKFGELEEVSTQFFSCQLRLFYDEPLIGTAYVFGHLMRTQGRAF